GPIRSLLHLLDRKDRITVIVAAETLDARFDMGKIARFVERMPSLDAEGTASVIERFRRGCLDESGDWIDAFPGRKDAMFHRPTEEPSVPGNDRPTLQDHLATLCATPRRLKSALRTAFDVWGPLVGEIDFDDVLLMSVLREAEPDVISLVNQHIGLLRKGWEPRGENKNQESPFKKELDRLLSEEQSEATRNAINVILNHVFDGWNKPHAPASIKRPQGFVVAGHADYWSRFLAVPDLTEDERDQPVLREMQRWENDRRGELPALVADPKRSEAVEDLSPFLSPEAVVTLLEKVIGDRAAELPEQWPSDESSIPEPPGIVPLWRMLLRNRSLGREEEHLEQVLATAVRQQTPRNLELVRWLELYYFTDEIDFRVLNENAINRLRAELTTALIRLSVDAIIGSLRHAGRWALYHCSWGRVQSRHQHELVPPPFEGWDGFSNRLLDALEQAPAIIVPQLIPFLVREDGGGYIFDKPMAESLFDVERLSVLLRRHPIPESAIPKPLLERYRVLMEAMEQDGD
ncbi:MAG: hypothetical protein GXP47_04910, partial [Acidobacteria bacterium]|nr:hypothetical protein [Acidobacteriota bacterium]